MCTYAGTTFYTNPQYKITVVDPDSEDENEKGTIIVGLMQKNRRQLKRELKDDCFLSIGYYIYRVSWKPFSLRFIIKYWILKSCNFSEACNYIRLQCWCVSLRISVFNLIWINDVLSSTCMNVSFKVNDNYNASKADQCGYEIEQKYMWAFLINVNQRGLNVLSGCGVHIVADVRMYIRTN